MTVGKTRESVESIVRKSNLSVLPLQFGDLTFDQ